MQEEKNYHIFSLVAKNIICMLFIHMHRHSFFRLVYSNKTFLVDKCNELRWANFQIKNYFMEYEARLK